MKKYLNIAEEILKALNEGKKVFRIDVPDYYYKLVNNSICYFNPQNRLFTINPEIYFEEHNNKFYTEEPESLKFEVNRAYKTRKGLKAFLYKIDTTSTPFCFVDGTGNYWVYNDGMIRSDGEFRDGDIVGYWEEEK